MKSDPVNGKYDHFMTRLKLNHIIKYTTLILILSRMNMPEATCSGSLYKNLRESVETCRSMKEYFLNWQAKIFMRWEYLFHRFHFRRQLVSPVSVSSVLYVELYSQDLKVISKGKFCIRNVNVAVNSEYPVISTDIYFCAPIQGICRTSVKAGSLWKARNCQSFLWL